MHIGKLLWNMPGIWIKILPSGAMMKLNRFLNLRKILRRYDDVVRDIRPLIDISNRIINHSPPLSMSEEGGE